MENSFESEKQKRIKELKNRTFFFLQEKLIHEENEMIEYKNYKMPLDIYRDNGIKFRTEHTKDLVDNLKKQICGFLNNKGGRMFMGVNDSRIVEGCRLTEKEKDTTKNDIANILSDFHPKCRTEKIKVSFVPVKNKVNDEFIPDLYVIKIIVKRGDPWKLYSLCSKSFRSYMRMDGQCVEMSACEIEEHIIKRSKLPRDELDLKEFDDPEPELVLIKKLVEENVSDMINAGKENTGIRRGARKLSVIKRGESKRLRKSSERGTGELNVTAHLPVETITLSQDHSISITDTSHNIILRKTRINPDLNKPNNIEVITNNNISSNWSPLSKSNSSSKKRVTVNSLSQSNKAKKQKLEKTKILEQSLSDPSNIKKEAPIKVVIANLNKTTTKEELIQFFKDFQIDSSKPIEIKSNPQGFTYATMFILSSSEAHRMQKEMSKKEFKNYLINITV